MKPQILLPILLLLGLILSVLACDDEGDQNRAYVVYEADLTEVENREDTMREILAIVEKRLEVLGGDESVVKLDDTQFKVWLKGVEDVQQAIDLIGEPYLIRFKEFIPDENGDFAFISDENEIPKFTMVKSGSGQYVAIPATGEISDETIELTSQHFKGSVEFGIPQNNVPTIYFGWDDEGSELFWQITSRMSSEIDGSAERKLGIFLGDKYISAPNVLMPIRDDIIITGMASDDAKRLVGLLNAGKMPVTLRLVESAGL
ncbi:MAG: hypothetical protein GY845_02100 [Planctomycetes bacterium]|nr:hypothetical protein [Planctomycetota bacterium]